MKREKWRTYLELGRVSNLPTVLTNVAVGFVLNGAGTEFGDLALGTVAVVCFYSGGMYLNDYWDRHIDRLEQPARPIPSGRISAKEVGVMTVVWFIIATLLLATVSHQAFLAGLVLLILILTYNRVHKRFRPSPFIMAGCRFMVYVIGALLASEALNRSVLFFGALLFAYLTGLTYIARLEHLNQISNNWPIALLFIPLPGSVAVHSTTPWKFLWVFPLLGCVLMSLKFLLGQKRHVGKSIGILIAGISLVDALFLATLDHPEYALAATLCFGMTLLLHRVVPGT
ncbi:UbiA family prenyltransferase [Candidatus Poribacteria bacterium]|nr:UbiA family prenyltransferase [Candidatus Poribacteria bacterium]